MYAPSNRSSTSTVRLAHSTADMKDVRPEALACLESLHRKWQSRNSKSKRPVEFANWLDNYDAADKCMSEVRGLERRMEKEFHDKKREMDDEFKAKVDIVEKVCSDNLELRFGLLEKELVAKFDAKLDSIPGKVQVKSAREAPTIEAFNKLRELVHGFNKANAKAKKPFSWGDNGKYTRVENARSLQSWLYTGVAAKAGLGPSYYDDFIVVRDGSELVTFDDQCKGSYHSSAYWIPARKYKSVRCSDWAPSMKEYDPRLEYIDPTTRVAWVADAVENRKRKHSEEPA